LALAYLGLMDDGILIIKEQKLHVEELV